MIPLSGSSRKVSIVETQGDQSSTVCMKDWGRPMIGVVQRTHDRVLKTTPGDSRGPYSIRRTRSPISFSGTCQSNPGGSRWLFWGQLDLLIRAMSCGDVRNNDMPESSISRASCGSVRNCAVLCGKGWSGLESDALSA